MPILSEIGRKHWKIRILVAGIYALLILGSVTTVYPFLVMVNGSVSGEIDIDEFNIVPRYLWDDLALWRRYLHTKYGQEPRFLRTTHEKDYRLDEDGRMKHRRRGLPTSDFLSAELPDLDPEDPKVRRRVEDYHEFMAQAVTPPFWRGAHFWSRGTRQEELSGITNVWMKERYLGDIANYNKRHSEFMEAFLNIGFPFGGRVRYHERDCRFPLIEVFFEMNELTEYVWQTVPRMMLARRLQHLYNFFLEEKYRDIATFNEAYGADYESFLTVPFSARLPEKEPARSDWEEYVKRPRQGLSFFFMRIDVNEETTRLFQDFLRDRYETIEDLNLAYRKRSLVKPEDLSDEVGSVPLDRYEHWVRIFSEIDFPGFTRIPGSNYNSFDEVELASTLPDPDYVPVGEDWRDFVEKVLPTRFIEAYTPEAAYVRFLEERYGTIGALNEAYGTDHPDFLHCKPPHVERDYLDFFELRGHYRRYYFVRNYRQVFERLELINVPIVRNTAVLCFSLILLSLTVNPLAAFALSRFGLPYTYKILLFCLATMAFPAEVTMIPNFLLIKHFGLLNTYWAIILPGVAGGFSIFLLKGFFDSLPEELFECARLEGCSEIGMFWRIAVPLSKPIFAVIALGSFMAAYGSFMWALVVCQKPEKWTLMVWLYQFQQIFSADVVMASLCLAAVPTLFVFIVCQKVIMRGIIVPTFK